MGQVLNILNIILIVFIILGTLAILIDVFSYPGRAILNLLLMIPEIAYVLYCMNYVDKGTFIKIQYFLASLGWSVFIILASFIIIIIQLFGKLYICTRKDGFPIFTGFACGFMYLLPLIMFSTMLIHAAVFLYCKWIFYSQTQKH